MAQPKVPVAPEAAALAKMVNYPVNLNTGIPDISVPLYNLKIGEINFPLTLNYHAGGFKTGERATRSGLGWSLSADIQITRTVNGADDLGGGYIGNEDIRAYDKNHPELDFTFNIQNAHALATGQMDGMPDKFNYKLLNKSGSFYFFKNIWGTGYSIVPVPFDNLKITYADGAFTIVDTDGTTYYFGSTGGPISYGNYQQYYTELSGDTRSTFKCRQIVNANTNEVIDFVYQAKAPVLYFNRKHSIEYYSNPNPCSMTWENIYATNTVVKTQYPGLNDYNQLLGNYRMFQLSSPKYMENFPNGKSVFHLPDFNGMTQTDNIYNMVPNNGSGLFVYGLALTQINFRTGSVSINGTEDINSIQIKNAAGEEVKTINFRQSTTYPQNTPIFANNAEYLKAGTRYLDSLEFTANGKRFETYKFRYANKFAFGDFLQGKDAWGYANANTTNVDPQNNTMAISQTGITQRFYRSINFNENCSNFIDNVLFTIGSPNGNAEATDETPLTAGMLRRIIYPTGGYVDFEYEGNSARQGVAGSEADIVAMTGGLRIKTISYSDGFSDKPSSYKYYRYGEFEEGTGLLINNPYQEYDYIKRSFKPYHYTQTMAYLTGPGSSGYSDDPRFTPIQYNCSNPSCVRIVTKEDKTTYLPASSTDYTYPTGAPIYYTRVTEYNQDLGLMTGKKVYKFCKPNDYGTYSFYSEAKVPGTNVDVLKTDGLMGVPTAIEDYEYKNGAFKMAHSKSFSYYKYAKSAQIRVIYAFQKIDYSAYEGTNTGPLPDLYMSGGTNIPFANESHGLQQIFSVGQYGIQIAKLLPLTETECWYTGNNDSIQTRVDYAYDNPTYLQPTRITTTTGTGSVSKAVKYAYDYPGVAVYDAMKSRNMISQPIEEINYHREGSLPETETGRTKTAYATFNAGIHILPSSISKSVGGGPLETELSFDIYGGTNVLQTTTRNSLVKSYLWDNTGVYPLVEVNGASYGVVNSLANNASLDASSLSAIKNLGSSLQTALPNSMVSTYAYKPMVGVTAITAPDGLSKYFSYDDYGRLLNVKDNQQRIVKQHEYVLAKTPAMASGDYYTFNKPEMHSYNAFGADGVRRLVNSVYTWNTVAGGIDETRPEANVLLKLNIWPSGGPIPNLVYLDLIQNGTVVVSKRIPYNVSNFSFDELYVEPGVYQVAIRYETNYNGSLCNFKLNNNTVRTGDTLTLQAGATYTGIMFNN